MCLSLPSWIGSVIYSSTTFCLLSRRRNAIVSSLGVNITLRQVAVCLILVSRMAKHHHHPFLRSLRAPSTLYEHSKHRTSKLVYKHSYNIASVAESFYGKRTHISWSSEHTYLTLHNTHTRTHTHIHTYTHTHIHRTES